MNLEAKSKARIGEFGKNCLNLIKSQIWTILNEVKGIYLSSVTMVVTLDSWGGGKAAAGGCTEVVINEPCYVPPVLEQNDEK